MSTVLASSYRNKAGQRLPHHENGRKRVRRSGVRFNWRAREFLFEAMAYRRSDEDGVFSSRWRLAHRAELADCGIPSDVAANDRRWSYVLLHGDDLETGWAASLLSDQQAKKLLALLEPHFQDSTGVWLVEDLQRRGGRG